MNRVTLGSTDLRVSRACFGTMTFGSQVDEAEAAAMVDYCLDHGINFFDTANVYNGGASETILGKVLNHRWGEVILASKVGNKAGDDPLDAGLSRAAIERAVEQTLRRLRTDYLDLYYLHQPDYATPLEETLAAMDRLVRAGKVRYAGASNYAAWQIARIAWLAERDSHLSTPVTQPMYNLLARGIEQEYLPMCGELGISTVVYNPLAGGLLTGKHEAGRAIPGTRFDGNQRYRDRYWHRPNFAAVERLSEIAAGAGRSLVSLSLGWLLHHTPVDGVVLGASSLEQLKENVEALEDGPLPEEAVRECDRVWDGIRGVSPLYNR